jgi:hypothetical protein
MNLAIRPELKPLISLKKLLPFSVLSQACSFDISPITVTRELDGCARAVIYSEATPYQKEQIRVTFYDLVERRQRQLEAHGNNVPAIKDRIYPGDRFVLTFTGTASPGVTGRDAKKTQIKEEIRQIIEKSRIFVVADTERISLTVKPVQSASPDCTG